MPARSTGHVHTQCRALSGTLHVWQRTYVRQKVKTHRRLWTESCIKKVSQTQTINYDDFHIQLRQRLNKLLHMPYSNNICCTCTYCQLTEESYGTILYIFCGKYVKLGNHVSENTRRDNATRSLHELAPQHLCALDTANIFVSKRTDILLCFRKKNGAINSLSKLSHIY